jgi:branched-chain amino acid transport system ATP-binding protein
MSLLEIQHLSVSYGNIQAVRSIDMALQEGERVCLIGANGAGKTTLLKAIAGMLPITHGSIHFGGHAITRLASYQIVHLGLALVPEGRGIFSRLSVQENLAMGAFIRRDKAAVQHETNEIYQRFPRLGEQQMLAISRALLSRPRLLLLDEPSMGLAPMMVKTIFETIHDIAKRGVSVLLVEQNARLALATCERGLVMESGALTLQGASATLAQDAVIQKSYFGE